MNGWELRVSSGNRDTDQRTVAHYQQQCASQGMVLNVQPLPEGGFYLRATPANQQQGGYGQAPQAAYAQAPQQAAYGAQQGTYGAQQGAYGAQQGAYGARPDQQAYGAQGGGYSQSSQSYSSGYQQPAMAGGAPAPGNLMAGAEVGGQGVVLDGARMAYLRKVYGLLLASAVIACLSGFVCITVGDTTMFTTDGHHRVAVPMVVAAMLDNPILMWGAFGVLFAMTFIASATSKVKGLNVVMLFLVAAIMGLQLAPMVFVAQAMAGLGRTMSSTPVRDAFTLTLATLFGITAYSFVSKRDFSYLRAFISMGFFVIFSAAILACFLDSEALWLAIACAGALLASLGLLYQTNRILKTSNMDNPVQDALGLIVELRNLFMWILRIAMSSRR